MPFAKDAHGAEIPVVGLESFVGNLGVLFKLDVFALSVDFGYVATGNFLVGAGVGINF